MKYLILYALLSCNNELQYAGKTLVGKDSVIVTRQVLKCDTIKNLGREFYSKKDLENYLKKNQKDMLNLEVFEFKGKDVSNQFKTK